jgi:hypothetical protein
VGSFGQQFVGYSTARSKPKQVFKTLETAESARTSGSCNRCRVKEKQKCNGRHCKFENRSHVVGRLPMQKKGSKKLTQ